MRLGGFFGVEGSVFRVGFGGFVLGFLGSKEASRERLEFLFLFLLVLLFLRAFGCSGLLKEIGMYAHCNKPKPYTRNTNYPKIQSTHHSKAEVLGFRV